MVFVFWGLVILLAVGIFWAIVSSAVRNGVELAMRNHQQWLDSRHRD